MPKRIEVEDVEAFYSQRPVSRTSMFHCLLEVDADWQFFPGSDFDKKTDPRSVVNRARGWIREHAPDCRVLKRFHDDGSVTLRTVALTQEELEERGKRRAEIQKRLAAKRIRMRQA